MLKPLVQEIAESDESAEPATKLIHKDDPMIYFMLNHASVLKLKSSDYNVRKTKSATLYEVKTEVVNRLKPLVKAEIYDSLRYTRFENAHFEGCDVRDSLDTSGNVILVLQLDYFLVSQSEGLNLKHTSFEV